MVDLDSSPTKLIEVVAIGKQLLMTRSSLTTFSIAKDVASRSAAAELSPALAGVPSHAASAWIGVVERWETASGKSRVRFSGRQEFRNSLCSAALPVRARVHQVRRAPSISHPINTNRKVNDCLHQCQPID